MNIKQVLILLGSAAIAVALAYLTASGQGIQDDEIARISIVGGIWTAATLGLVWAFRDQ